MSVDRLYEWPSYEFIYIYEFIHPLFVGCMNGYNINSYINKNSNVR